jgi:hypothetical protein
VESHSGIEAAHAHIVQKSALVEVRAEITIAELAGYGLRELVTGTDCRLPREIRGRTETADIAIGNQRSAMGCRTRMPTYGSTQSFSPLRAAVPVNPNKRASMLASASILL